jgi:hypothetical protein
MDVMGQNPLQKMMLVVLVIYLYPGSMQEYEEPPGEMNSSKFPLSRYLVHLSSARGHACGR